MQERLRIDLGRSSLLGRYLGAAHAAALFSVCWLPLPVGVLLLVSGGLLLSHYRYFRQYNGTAAGRVEALVIADGRCCLLLHDGQACHAVLARRQFVSTYLVVLQLRIAGSMRSKRVMVWRDAVSQDLYRRLKVMLRYA